MTLLLSSIFAGSQESDLKTAVQVMGVTEPETRSGQCDASYEVSVWYFQATDD
jgi:hypothetical protein